MDLNVIIKCLQDECNKNSWTHNVPKEIVKSLFDYCYWFRGWRMYEGEPVYVIGLSEDKYDFYWMTINNKEQKIKFITCLYSLKEKCTYVTKEWSTDEKTKIKEFVDKYFEEHPKENLIDFSI